MKIKATGASSTEETRRQEMVGIRQYLSIGQHKALILSIGQHKAIILSIGQHKAIILSIGQHKAVSIMVVIIIVSFPYPMESLYEVSAPLSVC